MSLLRRLDARVKKLQIWLWGTATRRVGRLLRQVSPVLFWINLGRAVLFGAMPVALSVVTAMAVGASAGVIRHGFASPDGNRLKLAMVLYVVVFAFAGLVSTASSSYGQWQARRVDARIRERVMRAALSPLGIRHLENQTMRRAFSAARNVGPSIGWTAGSAAGSLPSIIGERIREAGYVAVLLWLWWPLGVVFGLMAVVNMNEMEKAMTRVLTITAVMTTPPDAKYQFDLGMTSAPAKEVRIFGLGAWVSQRYRHMMLAFFGDAWSRRREYTPSLVVTLGVDAVLMAGAILWFGHAAMSGQLTIGTTALGFAAVMALTPRFTLDDALIVIAWGVLEAVQAAEAMAAAVSDDVHERGSRPAAGLPRSSIRFEGVSFSYPGSKTLVLDGLDLELRSGERTAIVGVNGAGKTTLVKLLCRLYEPTAGRITVDGVDISEFDSRSWRDQLAVLFQDFAHFDISALDNVRYGAVRRKPADLASAVEAAANRAGAGAVVAALAGGWETPLSHRYTGGTDLSGGQWQRVALARALYAVDGGARVLILDEPTANLDVSGEAEIYQDFVRLTSGAQGERLTTVLISHRFSTVRQADRIVLIAEGKVAEDGSHDTLMALGGTYADMFNAQASRFVDPSLEPTT